MRSENDEPQHVVNSMAPVRVCDNGGWTDTWFAGYGKVFNIAVYPYAEVQMKIYLNRGPGANVTINAENYGDRYTIEAPEGDYDKHPLLEAAIDYMEIPDNVDIEVSLYSEMPSGCSTGTSAAVSVAMIGALDTLAPGRLTPHEIAGAAHDIETEMLGQQCGIQDQLASAYGGINFIDMWEYPNASVSQIRISEELWWELESRLSLIFLGQAHSSSQVHEKVIEDLEEGGPGCEKLKPLRAAAIKSRDALYAGDLDALANAMVENTEAQAVLHPSLVGPGHRAVIELAQEFGANGWKVNGAGGDGGSVTILGPADRTMKRDMLKAMREHDPKFQHIPINICPFGLRVWDSRIRRPSARHAGFTSEIME